ncbi:MAG: hypothetical protein QNK89_10130 [Lacinutrix sp.]|jgi:hypothetical protein|uniref:hypothetical protein n=1 Tax=Lacinutrix sp. TaxID=1937692 RepID=UPI0030B31CF0
MSKKVNLNSSNSKVINGTVFVTALKCHEMSKMLAEEIQHGNNITHPTLGIMYQYNGKFSRSNS